MDIVAVVVVVSSLCLVLVLVSSPLREAKRIRWSHGMVAAIEDARKQVASYFHDHELRAEFAQKWASLMAGEWDGYGIDQWSRAQKWITREGIVAVMRNKVPGSGAMTETEICKAAFIACAEDEILERPSILVRKW